MELIWAKGFGALMLFVGIYMVIHHRRSRRLLEESQRWPSAKGEIVESRVKRKGGSDPVYEARVKYRFAVGGQELTSKAVTIGGKLRGSRKRAENWIERFPRGAAVDVYYDPANPGNCCLERTHEGGWLELVGAVFGIGAGLVLLLGVIP